VTGEPSLPAPRLAGLGLLVGDDQPAPDGRPRPGGLRLVPTPALDGDRFRRATRECLLAVAAVKQAVGDAGLPEAALAGSRTGILYVTASGYAAANHAFLVDGGSTTLHFPYTSPSAVPGEVTIELGIRGPYVNLMGGGTTALYGLWYAARWLADGIADRVLLLAVEAFQEVAALFARAGRLYREPLVEGACCLVLVPGTAGGSGLLRWATAAPARGGSRDQVEAVLDGVLAGQRPGRVASTVTTGALGRAERAALATVREAPRRDSGLFTAAWRGEYGAVLWPAAG
jgi:hypothetical protein